MVSSFLVLSGACLYVILVKERGFASLLISAVFGVLVVVFSSSLFWLRLISCSGFACLVVLGLLTVGSLFLSVASGLWHLKDVSSGR